MWGASPPTFLRAFPGPRGAHALHKPRQRSAITDGGKALHAYEMHLLQALITGFGLLTVVLAFLIYRAPMMVAIVVSLAFAGIFYAFIRLNHSGLPALYVLASLPILAVVIKTIFSAVQFNQSFARMGRPEDH